MNEYKIVIEALNKSGKEGFLVGGCVRDLLLGRIPHDFDVTTNALPSETKEIFSSYRVIETGEKHGTVTVLIGQEPVEVTTYRIEGAYSDHRHPDNVSFSDDLSHDLSRRDFTVNAMAMDLDGRVIDLYGGENDLKKKLIRCVGDPEKRFEEDALRILRALRFSAQLGFEIDEKTAEAARRMAGSISYVSRERCFAELKKLLISPNAEEVLIKYNDILSELIPELSFMHSYDQCNPHHCYSLDVHIAKVVSGVPANEVLRLAAFFHDIGKPLTESKDENGISHYYGHARKSAEIADRSLKELKCDNKTREEVVFLVNHHDAPAETTKEQVLKKLNRYGVERYRMLICLRRADNLAQAKEYYREEQHDKCEQFIEELLRERACFSLKDLKINGNDLISMGVPQTPVLGAILNQLLSEVISGKLYNERDELIGRAKELFLKKCHI